MTGQLYKVLSDFVLRMDDCLGEGGGGVLDACMVPVLF